MRVLWRSKSVKKQKKSIEGSNGQAKKEGASKNEIHKKQISEKHEKKNSEGMDRSGKPRR